MILANQNLSHTNKIKKQINIQLIIVHSFRCFKNFGRINFKT